MPRRNRLDEPGSWHHVMNRGIAKRPVFLGRPEARYFLSRLAREVRRGRLELHGFCLMTTHFHLLVRSPIAELSEAMRCAINSFVRWFNRRHRRDGSLFRARFTSFNIHSDEYRENVIRYIDQNPVDAGLARTPAQYPHGSARWLQGKTRPIWLAATTQGNLAPAPSVNGKPNKLNAHAAWVIERRLESKTGADPLDDLLGATHTKVRAWMEHKAHVADGTGARQCLLSPEALRLSLIRARDQHGPCRASPGARRKDAWRILEIGLHMEMVGLSTTETALALGMARSTAGHGLPEHRHLMLTDSLYRERAAEVLRYGLALTFGSGSRRAARRDDRAGLDCRGDRA